MQKSDNFILLLGCVLLAVFPEVLILSVMVIVFIKEIRFNHIYVLIALAVLMGITILIYPDYLYIPVQTAFIGVKSAFESMIGTDDDFSLFKFLFGYTFLGHLFLLHVSSILVLVAELVLKDRLEVKTFSKATQIIKPKKEIDKMLAQQTLLGYKGKRPVYVNDNARHIFVCGTTGSGKTVALANFIESAIIKDYPLVLIDGKGDLGNGSILEIVNKFKGDKKLYVINLSDIGSSCSYNPFKDASSTMAKDMLVSLTEWSEEHYKANTERYIQRLIHLMELNEIPLSFETLLKYFPVDVMTDLSVMSYKTEKITKSEHMHTLEIIKASGDIAMNAAARFITLQESEIGYLLNSEGIDIAQAIEENAIILFVLNPLIYPEMTKLFGRLILTDCKKAVSSLYMNHKERVFFIFDEINTYASSVLIDLLNKSRSANVTCLCATQSLADLEQASSEAFREQVIENCNNYIVMRQNSAKYSEVWAKTFGTEESLSVTYQLGKNGDMSNATGRGTATKERKYIYHPDTIKNLKTGQAIFVSKDTSDHAQINVRKGF